MNRGGRLVHAQTVAQEDGNVSRAGVLVRPPNDAAKLFSNTATGYQEILTDPSYAGQIVILTNPQIGNYGTNPNDDESAHPQIEG
jgi:carbamoyl-phosphate synthase small subunit